jgi:hypothetical protein
MQRMELAQDENLRQQGWRVFRSSTRNRMIPLTGSGAKLQRIKIQEAFPVAGVFEGAAASDELREVVANTKAAAMARSKGGEDVATGVMQYFSMILHNRVAGAVNGVPLDELFIVGTAPFDGWLREISADGTGGDQGGFRLAVRTSGGGTLFKGFDQTDLAAFTEFCEPDFLPLDARGTGNYVIDLRAGKVPCYAGDQIIVVLRNTNGKAVNASRARVQIGIEAVIFGSLSQRISGATLGLSMSQAAAANRQAAADALRLQIEQEKTRRQMLADEAALARINAVAGARLAEARLPAPSPAPRAKPAPREIPEGTGKTFVSAWNPSYGNIGYLIPDPPRGGKVNVFDNKYSVFDITGKLIEQGQIIPVATDQQIPPGARLSAVSKGTLSPAMALDLARSQF